MSIHLKKSVGLFLAGMLGIGVHGQECPTNIDFEQGNFNNWQVQWGSVNSLSGVNELVWQGYTQDPNRHLLIKAPDTTRDFYGKFPRLCPNGSGVSVKLGNEFNGAQAESISYVFQVPTSASNYSLFFYYAVVLEDPAHNAEQQPRFRARIIRRDTGEPIECVSFDFTANGSLPGFLPSVEKPNVLYKNWTPITIDLTPFRGLSLMLEFITSDCTLQGHFGYAYVDVGSRCDGAIGGTTICEGDAVGSLTAPFGFASYTWYADNSFTTVVGNAQHLTLSPPPPTGATFPVVLEPFPGFGCRDTLRATITSAPNPVVQAGSDRTICTYEQAQLGTTPVPGWSYSWTPAEFVSNPTGSNPLTLFSLPGPTNFQVTATNLVTGCKGTDNVLITPVIIDTSMRIDGDLVFCRDAAKNTSLTILQPGDAIRWFANNQLVPGAILPRLDPRPSVTTRYFAEITKNGCRDSSSVVTVTIAPSPFAAFRPERNLLCKDLPARFINTSTISNQEVLSYTWRRENGLTSTEKNFETIFASAGSQMVSLKVVSAFGCVDSVSQFFDVAENCYVDIPSAFTPNGDGLNDLFRPTLNGIRHLKRFDVYDRWGKLVYRTRTIDEGWDGKYGGLPMVTGVYVWLLEYDSYEKEGIVRKGTVTLIR